MLQKQGDILSLAYTSFILRLPTRPTQTDSFEQKDIWTVAVTKARQ